MSSGSSTMAPEKSLAPEKSSETNTTTPTTEQTQPSLHAEHTGTTPDQAKQVREQARSFIDGTDPKILAQRFRNMGLINNAERDQILALAADKQLEALIKIRDQAEQVQAVASEASRAGIISHAQFMALYHSANGATDANGNAPKYSLQERAERTKALRDALEKIKKGESSVDQAKKDYLNFKHTPAASSASPSGAGNVPQTPPSNAPSTVLTTPTTNSPTTPAGSTTSPEKTTLPTVPAKPDPEKKPLTPEQQKAFTQIEQTNFFTRMQKPVYDRLLAEADREAGVPPLKSTDPNSSILVSDRELIKKFHRDVTQLIMANDAFLKTALAGKNIEINFHNDLKKVAFAPGEKPKPGQTFLGVSVVELANGENGETLAVYLDPALMRNPAKSILIVLHELTHVARRLNGSTLPREQEEIKVIELTLESVQKVFEQVTDPQTKRSLATYIQAERYRLRQLKKSTGN